MAPSESKKTVTIQEPEEEEYQVNRKGFVNTQGKFLAKGPGSVTGSDFLIEKCDTCQLYVHDMMKSCKVNLCQNSSIVLGPVQSLCQVDIVNDSKMVVFCDQIKIRDCHNLEIMLCSPNPVSWSQEFRSAHYFTLLNAVNFFICFFMLDSLSLKTARTYNSCPCFTSTLSS